jgi:hypothetical protein
MSAATDLFTEIVHVRLLDEGVDVWRPVRARPLPTGAYELAPDPIPSGELWEFAPGEQVSVKDRSFGDGSGIVAVSRSGRQRKPAGRH